MKDKFAVLKDYFGYTDFRPGQEELVDALAQGRDAFGIMPTGAGKSLCFQIPALMAEGITLVVSPLISLMKDQVYALNQAGARAAYLNSSLTAGQYRLALERAAQGAYKIIYVAPERLFTDAFLAFVQQAEIAMVCVDEAHCVSQWGQDFRPGYLKIQQFVEALPSRPVLGAFTATATTQVQKDVVELLRLENPVVVKTGFDRANLHFDVRKPRDKFAELLHILQENAENSGIIYCSTRKAVEEVCDRLNQAGYSAVCYHAGLPDQDRRNNQDAFLFDKASIMVATNAFGMGIDKSNVRFVVHFNMPKDLESYYQEAGRAGRDGEPAQCVLLYSGQDVRLNQFLIENSRDNDELEEDVRDEVIKRDKERLKQMTFYCNTQDCLRAYILRYFGETGLSYCGNCGNCAPKGEDYEEKDITRDAQKILWAVRQTGERFGTRRILLFLRGETSAPGIPGETSVFASLANVPEHTLQSELSFLQRMGYLKATDDVYHVLKLTEKAEELFAGTQTIKMMLQKPRPVSAPVHKKQAPAAGPVDEALFEQLRQLRSKLANAQGVPAYVVFSDATLRDMCAKRPQNNAELMQVSGVGATKAQRYGEKFLALFRE